MWRTTATLLVIALTAGCALEVQDPGEPASEASEDVQNDAISAPPPAAPYEDGSGEWPSDPCGGGQAGTVYVLAGREVFVPAECDPHYQEMGDPPDVSEL
jgi:hypothetical protein